MRHHRCSTLFLPPLAPGQIVVFSRTKMSRFLRLRGVRESDRSPSIAYAAQATLLPPQVREASRDKSTLLGRGTISWWGALAHPRFLPSGFPSLPAPWQARTAESAAHTPFLQSCFAGTSSRRSLPTTEAF